MDWGRSYITLHELLCFHIVPSCLKQWCTGKLGKLCNRKTFHRNLNHEKTHWDRWQNQETPAGRKRDENVGKLTTVQSGQSWSLVKHTRTHTHVCILCVYESFWISVCFSANAWVCVCVLGVTDDVMLVFTGVWLQWTQRASSSSVRCVSGWMSCHISSCRGWVGLLMMALILSPCP